MRGGHWIVIVLAACAPALHAATLTVDLNGRADFSDIQTAIDAAANGDTIAVFPGTYLVDQPIDFNRFHVPGDDSSPPRKDILVRAEGPSEETVIRVSAAADPDLASAFVFQSGETGASVLEGFTLTGGSGSRVDGVGHGGGGVLCTNGSSPVIRGCIITGNSAETAGGAVLTAGGSAPRFIECTIAGNSSGEDGGGAYAGAGSRPEFLRSVLRENLAERDGGGVFAAGAAPVVSATRVFRNRAERLGGGLACSGDASPVVVNSVLSGNVAGGSGGGVAALDGSSPEVLNSTLTGNFALGAHPLFPVIGAGAGLFAATGSAPRVVNSILWGNLDEAVLEELGSTVEIVFSCVQGDEIWPGPGNIAADPVFLLEGHTSDSGDPKGVVGDWVEGDYHLVPGSPCIDSGTDEGAPSDDMEGNGRPCGAGTDMGAFETGGCKAVVEDRFVRGDVNNDGDGNLSDAVAILGFLFLGGPAPGCLASADIDDSERIELTDSVYLLSFLFLGGPAPPPPFEACGPDPTAGLECGAFPRCE